MNRLVLPKSSYRRQGSAPRCRLEHQWVHKGAIPFANLAYNGEPYDVILNYIMAIPCEIQRMKYANFTSTRFIDWKRFGRYTY
jgi:hypothetical protein